MEFPANIPPELHEKDVTDGCLELWLAGGTYSACETLYEKISADLDSVEPINNPRSEQQLIRENFLKKVGNWFQKGSTGDVKEMLAAPPFTCSIRPTIFFGDLLRIPEVFVKDRRYSPFPIVIVEPFHMPSLSPRENIRVELFYRYLCRKEECPIEVLRESFEKCIKTYVELYEIRRRKPPSPGILNSGLDKLLAACVVSSRRATDFIGILYELSVKPSPSGVQVLVEPKRKVFELLDMAKEILSPLTGYETTAQEILDTFEELHAVSLQSEWFPDPNQLSKLRKSVNDIVQGIQTWIEWWHWTVEQEEKVAKNPHIPFTVLLWPGSSQTELAAIRHLHNGAQKLCLMPSVNTSTTEDLTRWYERLYPWSPTLRPRLSVFSSRVYTYKKKGRKLSDHGDSSNEDIPENENHVPMPSDQHRIKGRRIGFDSRFIGGIGGGNASENTINSVLGGFVGRLFKQSKANIKM